MLLNLLCIPFNRGGPGAMVRRRRSFDAEELGLNLTPDKLTEHGSRDELGLKAR